MRVYESVNISALLKVSSIKAVFRITALRCCNTISNRVPLFVVNNTADPYTNTTEERCTLLASDLVIKRQLKPVSLFFTWRQALHCIILSLKRGALIHLNVLHKRKMFYDVFGFIYNTKVGIITVQHNAVIG